jgi:hypothetical protein
MAEPTRALPDGIICRVAGGEWPITVEDGTEPSAASAVRDELASWLGPWARAFHPGEADDARAAGLVTFTVDAGATPDGAPEIIPHVEPIPGGFLLVERGYEVRLERRGGRDAAAVRSMPLCARAAVRTAVRMLACRRVVTAGGLALHASSVRSRGGLFVFAGPSGAGKTSAAETFAPADRLDQDLVLLAREGGSWVRLDMFDEYEPTRFAPGEGAGLEVRAVLLPARGRGFGLEHLSGSDAVRACLHVPAGWGAAGTRALLERAEAFAGSVTVARMAWALGQDLPRLLASALA